MTRHSGSVGALAKVRRFVRWHRRAVATVLAAIGVVALGSALAPPPIDTLPVVVAARTIEPGATLTSDDLTVARFPRSVAPASAYSDAEALLGRTMAAGLSRGTPLDPAQLVGPATKKPGELLVALRVPDAAAATLVSVGAIINVYAAQPSGTSELVASEVRVAATPTPRSDSLTGSSESGMVVIVAASAEQAARLAVLNAGWAISVALV